MLSFTELWLLNGQSLSMTSPQVYVLLEIIFIFLSLVSRSLILAIYLFNEKCDLPR